MLFLLKKWIGGLLMPLPLFLTVFFIALILLIFTKKQKIAKSMLVISFVFLFSVSFMPVTEQFVHPLERKHLPIQQNKVAQKFDYILLLGSGGIADPSLPVNSQLSLVANSRFLEALRLFNSNRNATLIVSGSGFGDVKSHAKMMEELAIIMGIPSTQIIVLEETLDTADEAKAMSEIIRGKHAALVTSALHMDRALNLFYQQGTAPTAAPTGFLARNRQGKMPSYQYIPSAHHLNRTRVAWHEYLGNLQRWVVSLF